MATYSFFMEFRGGKYIDQITAPNLKNAIETWANTLNVNEIQYLGKKQKQYLIENIDEVYEFLLAMEIVQNIWITHFDFKTGASTIHIFKTDLAPEVE